MLGRQYCLITIFLLKSNSASLFLQISNIEVEALAIHSVNSIHAEILFHNKYILPEERVQVLKINLIVIKYIYYLFDE